MKNDLCDKGIIFDMDGTLWDSSEQVAKSWNLAIRDSGAADLVLSADDIQRVMGMTMEAIADELFGMLSKEDRMKLLSHCCNVENDYLRENGGRLYEGVEETLGILKESYPLFIVSNCQSGYIEAFLDYYGFGQYFTDIECYGNNLKQKAENIRLIVGRNHLKQAVYVGDIEADYRASKEAGVDFIHAAYGFGKIGDQVKEVSDFRELASAAFFQGE